jgi:hypothetical protein
VSEYPYLVVRLIASVYQREPLPPGLAPERILALAQQYGAKHKFRVCVVWAADRATYLELDGRRSESSEPPSEGVPVRCKIPPLSSALDRPTLEFPEWLLGPWVTRRPVDHHGVLLELRSDGSYTLSPRPTWLAGQGTWGVWQSLAGPLLLGLERNDGVLQAGLLVSQGAQGLFSSWLWRESLRQGQEQGRLVWTASRPADWSAQLTRQH